MVFYYPILAFMQSLMFGFENLDPLYFCADALHLENLKRSWTFTIFRHLHLHVWNQFILLNARACILITVGMTFSYFQILKQLNLNIALAKDVTRSFKIYQRLRIILCLLWANVNTVIGSCLANGFLMVILGTCGSIFAFKSGNNIVPLLFFTILTIAMFAVLVSFKFACFMLDFSSNLLHRWKVTQIRRNFGYLNKKIRACRPLFIKAGSVGIISKRMQAKYLSALLESTLNVLLILSGWSM